MFTKRLLNLIALDCPPVSPLLRNRGYRVLRFRVSRPPSHNRSQSSQPPPPPSLPQLLQLPRHGASCPVGIGVSCSADRQALGKITAEGVFLEQLERDVGQYLPEVDEQQISPEVC